MDERKVEQAALDAITRYRRMHGTSTTAEEIAKAIAAAIAEYDRQKAASK